MKKKTELLSGAAMSTTPLGCGGKLENKTVEDICDYLEEKGFNVSVIEAFQG